MARTKGITSFSSNFETHYALPLDARQVVSAYSDLTSSTTWQGNDGVVYAYVGMIVSVTGGTDAGLYRLTASDYTDTSNWSKVGSSTTSTDNGEPTGFNRSSTASMGDISFTDATRVFTHSVSSGETEFYYYVNAVKYTKTSSQTITISDVTGLHFIYYDDSTLTESVNPSNDSIRSIIQTKALVSIIYWNSTDAVGIYVAEERHGIVMDGLTHQYLHFTEGMKYDKGLGLNSITTDQDGSSDTHAQFGVDAGSTYDEDIFHDISAITSTTGLPIYYMTGASGIWTRTTNSGFSVVTQDGTTSTRLAYNEWTGSTWQLTEVTNGDFVLCHIFATSEKDKPLVAIIGQDIYTRKRTARKGALTEIKSLILDDLLFPEIKPIATVIFQTRLSYTNNVNARIVSTDEGDDYIDWRDEAISRVSFSTTDHGSLSGLGDDDHEQYLLRGTTNQGDIWYDNGTEWTRLTPGTSGQYLKTNGAGANPQWDTISGSGNIEDGTADHQVPWWDNTASEWKHSDRLYWDNANHKMQVAGTSLVPSGPTFAVKGNTSLGTTVKSASFTANEYTSYIVRATTSNISITIPTAAEAYYGVVLMFYIDVLTYEISIPSIEYFFNYEGETLTMQCLSDGSNYYWKVINCNNMVKHERNYIINGAMDVWQRGTSFTTVPNGYVMDRFWFWKGGTTGNASLSRSTDTPNSDFNYSGKIACTAADTSAGGSDYLYFGQTIEGYNFKHLVGRSAVLSFWVKSNKTGTYSVSLRNSGSDRSYISTYSIDSSNTWEQKFIHIVFNESGGTWDYTNGKGLRIAWDLMCGTTYSNSIVDTWLSGNYIASNNNVNFLDSTSNEFYITGVQLTEGSIELPFLHRSIAEEVDLCQRYYEKSYNIGTAPGSVTSAGATCYTNMVNRQWLETLQRYFVTRKRTAPTMTWYSITTGTSSRVSYYSSHNWYDATVTSTSRVSESSTGYVGVSAAIGDQIPIQAQWTANAEL